MRKISLLIGYLISMYAGNAQKTYIWCGTLIDGKSDEAKKEMTIVVEKNRIVSVDKGYTNAGGGDSIINLKNKTVTPGWMDMHVHLEEETSPNRFLEEFTLNPADIAFNAARYAVDVAKKYGSEILFLSVVPSKIHHGASSGIFGAIPPSYINEYKDETARVYINRTACCHVYSCCGGWIIAFGFVCHPPRQQ